MDNLRGLLGIRIMDKLMVWIKGLCGVTKSMDKKIYESVLRLFSLMERLENDRIAKRVYVGKEDCVE